MSETVAILKRAREILNQQEAWTQQAFARDCVGASLEDPAHKAATCWCMLGALRKSLREFTGTHTGYLKTQAFDYLKEACECSPVMFNDIFAKNHAEILETFDKAIALAVSS